MPGCQLGQGMPKSVCTLFWCRKPSLRTSYRKNCRACKVAIQPHKMMSSPKPNLHYLAVGALFLLCTQAISTRLIGNMRSLSTKYADSRAALWSIKVDKEDVHTTGFNAAALKAECRCKNTSSSPEVCLGKFPDCFTRVGSLNLPSILRLQQT